MSLLDTVLFPAACALVPLFLFGLGYAVQSLASGYRATWVIPTAFAVLLLNSWVLWLLRAPAVLLPAVPVCLGIAGLWKALRSRAAFPAGDVRLYVALCWLACLLLSAFRYAGFGLDWVERGIRMPAALVARQPLVTIRTCAASLVYGDAYRLFSPDFSRYYLVQILSLCLNAAIVFAFRDLSGGALRWPALLCALAAPFVMYELVFAWPKLLAIALAYAALDGMYGGGGRRLAFVAGACMAGLACLVHPTALFVLLPAPLFLRAWRGQPASRGRLVGGLACSLVMGLWVPGAFMRTLGAEMTSATAYFPFFERWEDAMAAAAAHVPLMECVRNYADTVGVVGAAKTRAMSLVHTIVPIADISRYGFYETLVFAMGPVPAALAAVHLARTFLRDRRVALELLLFAGAPALIGTLFWSGYMMLQQYVGQWVVMVLLAYALRDLGTWKSNLQRALLAVSVGWSSIYLAFVAYRIHVKSPDWSPGIEAALNAVGAIIPGFSSATPRYAGDWIPLPVSLVAFVGAGLALALLVSLCSGGRGDHSAPCSDGSRSS